MMVKWRTGSPHNFECLAQNIETMCETKIKCNLIQLLLARHGHGGPFPKEMVVNNAGIRSDLIGEAKDVFDEIRSDIFINQYGSEYIELDNSNFYELAEFLYHECEWEAIKIKRRMSHHYEGWDNHEWA